MGIRLRALLVLLLLSLVAGGVVYRHLWKSMEVRYREAVEENMVDQAQLLAALLSTGTSLDSMAKGLDELKQRRFKAQIYELTKTQSRLRVSVTDARGIVVFHSEHPEVVGQDYAGWRDVWLTLRGAYGARSTRDDYRDEGSSVLHVAAPILREGRIVGVVTVAKPARDFQFFIDYARSELLVWFVCIGLGVLVLGALLIVWVTSPLGRLRSAARQLLGVQDPRGLQRLLPDSETLVVHQALEDLRADLQAKSYVEHYVQVLTHELKSPLSAIRGAAEILEGPLAEEDRKRFLGNIQLESARMRELVDAILHVSALERQECFERPQSFDLTLLVRQALDGLDVQCHAKALSLEVALLGSCPLWGDPLLTRQAVHNILLNAVEHSPKGGTLWVDLQDASSSAVLRVRDAGPGIPDYALSRLGEKFYSLPKPDTGRKGTGLGLALVREVARLYRGGFVLDNAAEGGAVATMWFARYSD